MSGDGQARKPAHLDETYASQWEDAEMAADYPHRPPYPEALFDHLVADKVLDLGCGTGDIARRLAPRVGRVDALDRSAAMIEVGRRLPGGDLPRWIVGTAETAPLDGPYGLVVAGECFHWMNWWEVLPRLDTKRFALVERFQELPPWHDALRAIIPRYSTNTDFKPYEAADELEQRDLVAFEPPVVIAPEPFTQPLASYVASFHSRNGLSRARMDPTAFDREVAALVGAETVTLQVGARIWWAASDPGPARSS